MSRRTQGTGAIYQRSHDRRWVASFDVPRAHGEPRRRITMSALTREALDGKIADAIAAGRIIPAPRADGYTRAEREAAAPGDHTDAEWWAKVRGLPRACPYCEVPLNVYNGVKDHRIPLARGGSNDVGNLDYVCWQCNAEKAAHTPEEFAYRGPRPRPFAPMPSRAEEFYRVTR